MQDIPSFRLVDYLWWAQQSDSMLYLRDRSRPILLELPIESEPEPPLLDTTTPSTQGTLFDLDACERTIPPGLRFIGHIWPEFRDEIIDAWLMLNPEIRRCLLRRHVTVQVYDLFMPHLPDFSFQTYLRAGIYAKQPRNILLSQSQIWPPFVSTPVLEGGRILWHEVGHAIDFTFGMLSDRPGFIEAYRVDRKILADDDDAWSRYRYYLEGGAYGRHEAFAETWAQQGLAVASAAKFMGDMDFKLRFPNCWAWIHQNVPSALDGFALPAKTINTVDTGGMMPLQNLGGSLDREEIGEVLARGADPLIADRFGKTPLELAMQRQQHELVHGMLSHICRKPALLDRSELQKLVIRCQAYIKAHFANEQEMFENILDRGKGGRKKRVVAVEGFEPPTKGL